MNASSIEWCDITWNFTTGCEIDDVDCVHCYAMRQAARFAGEGQVSEGLIRFGKKGAVWSGKVGHRPHKLTEPIRRRTPAYIFVDSMSDPLHKHQPDDVIDQMTAVMHLCPHHTFIVLTKRWDRLLRYLHMPTLYDRVLRHAERLRHRYPHLSTVGIADPAAHPAKWIWWGISAGNQATYDKRIRGVLGLPEGAIGVLSLEPLIGPIDIAPALATGKVRWVIAGAESGPGRRPCHVDWLRRIRDACVVADVPFFLKQWVGEPPDGIAGRSAYDPRRPKISLPLLDGHAWTQRPQLWTPPFTTRT